MLLLIALLGTSAFASPSAVHKARLEVTLGCRDGKVAIAQNTELLLVRDDGAEDRIDPSSIMGCDVPLTYDETTRELRVKDFSFGVVQIDPQWCVNGGAGPGQSHLVASAPITVEEKIDPACRLSLDVDPIYAAINWRTHRRTQVRIGDARSGIRFDLRYFAQFRDRAVCKRPEAMRAESQDKCRVKVTR